MSTLRLWGNNLTSRDRWDNKRFKTLQVAHIAGYILERLDDKADSLKLMSLMYLVDRESMSKRCHPVSSDSFVSTKDGMALQKTFKLMKKSHASPSVWCEMIRKDEEGNHELIDRDDDFGLLSDYSCEMIGRVTSEFGGASGAELSEYIKRDCPEWIPTDGKHIPVSMFDILIHLGFDKTTARHSSEEYLSLNACDEAWGIGWE